jgi:hypothetical protein
VRYALQRRQFSAPDDEGEVLIMDYLAHQRRLFPLIARSYALEFAQNELVAKLHDVQTADSPDAEEQRELESRAAGLKAANTWHASTAIQEAPEACGGAGYLAKELLTAYADDIKGMSPVEWVRLAANLAGDRVLKRTAAEAIRQGILDTLSVIEDDKTWFIEHRFLSTERAKAVTRGINESRRTLRPYAELLVEGFGIPEQLRYAEMLHPEHLGDRPRCVPATAGALRARTA